MTPAPSCFFDPYFVRAVSEPGAIRILLAFGAAGGIGGGLGYLLTIERRWRHGRPRPTHTHPIIRITRSLALGIFEGILVYVVMANFHNAYDIFTGILWGTIDGVPWGQFFGFLLACLLVGSSPTRPEEPENDIGEGDIALLQMVVDDAERGTGGEESEATSDWTTSSVVWYYADNATLRAELGAIPVGQRSFIH